MNQESSRPPKSPPRHGTGPLAQYRLYFRSAGDGHISHSHEFEAEDDARAIRVCEGWREGRGAELWCGAREVCAWEADD